MSSPSACSTLTPCREEVPEFAVSLLRRLLREIMPARQGLGAADISRVTRPDLGRLVVAPDSAARARQKQHRAADLPAGLGFLGIHIEIDSEGRAMVRGLA